MKRLFFFLMLITLHFLASAGKKPQDFGLDFQVNNKALTARANQATDSLLRSHPYIRSKTVQAAIARKRAVSHHTADFYWLTGLVLILGLIRAFHPRYLFNVFRAFWNVSLSRRQLQEQLGAATMPNLLMNFFFALVAGTYLYYMAAIFTASNMASLRLLSIFIGGVMIIYLVKYAIVKFSGWAFRVETLTDQYLFSIFLINKIIGVILLPFLVFFAFAGPAWSKPLCILSLFIIAGLLFSRYARSWQSLGSFFQYSKFHFLTYFCASEILPLAILMKLLSHFFMH